MKHQNKCVICGEPKEYPFSPLCIKCLPYMYKKGRYPHQNIRRTKKWAENREKRLQGANYACMMCGGGVSKSLSVHHKIIIDYKQIWESLVNEKVQFLLNTEKTWMSEEYITKKKEEIKEEYRRKISSEKVKVCPYCDSSNLSERKYKKQKYFCSNCKKEFDKPVIRFSNKNRSGITELQLRNKTIREILIQIENEIVEHNYNELIEKYHKGKELMLQDYLSMKDTIVLCKPCHLARENSKKLCKICKKGYHYPKYKMCLACFRRKKYNIPLGERFPKCVHEVGNICSHFGMLADYGKYITCNPEKRGFCSYYNKAKQLETPEINTIF